MKYDIQSLKEKLLSLNVRPNKKLGQNFLVNQTVCSKITSEVDNIDFNTLVEVGPGLGALTELLNKNKLVLLELDKSFAEYWKEQNFEVIHADALHYDWAQFQRPAVLISNLPYQISSTLVIDRSMDKDRFEKMILMFQKEVAQRMMASPKTSDYGLLTVIAQNFWKVEFLLEAGPKDFYPAPQVASRVLVFHKLPTEIKNAEKFLKFVKEAFKQRRKFLVSNIASFVTKEKSKEVLSKLGFKETVRPEELSPKDFLNLYKNLGFE